MVDSVTRAHALWHPYTKGGIEDDVPHITKAEGVWLYDETGKRYMDVIGSWWVNLHGHSHPTLVEALQRQARTLDHIAFAGATHQGALDVARRLVDAVGAPFERVFFSDNGSTAVEVALKMAWQYWHNQGERRQRFMAFQGGYHGDTLGAMSAGFSCGFYEPFASMVFPFDFVPYPASWHGVNDEEEREAHALSCLVQQLEAHKGQLAAIIIEPLVQGAAGMRMCSPRFLEHVVAEAQAQGVLVIFDEVLTGFYRTGKMFACDHLQHKPDIICLAKGLTGGMLPLAATLVSSRVFSAFADTDPAHSFMHGHSYTANPLGCAVAHASMDLLNTPTTQARIRAIIDVHRERLADCAPYAFMRHRRQCGVVVAFECGTHNDDGHYHHAISKRLRRHYAQQGLWLRPLGTTLYMVPPYCITDAELHQAWDIIISVLQKECA
ncbi:MAG: adenosylmethionine--8-amino-7-oxononanoate transaminase [Alphaproteobacteria bacterium GM7ARS4]|nr:adenosylmethionine--8-amino-7-oxononanoate transaminase [Alphaproteobacteria bacterium GM7ARS4]